MCNIGGQIGPFMFNPACPPKERVVGDTTFLVGIATAYNAMGLIGTEHNGVFILDDTNRTVVMDRHAEGSGGGFGPYPSQLAERERLLALSDAEFIGFIESNPRYRGVCLPSVEEIA